MIGNLRPGAILITSLTALIISAACSSEERSGDYVRTEIDGIPFRVYQVYEPPFVEPYRLEEVQVIGTDQGADTYVLYNFHDLILGKNHDLYLYDFSDVKIHRFDLTGRHLGQFGRSGQGPGDFGTASSLFFVDDKLVVYDLRNLRLSYFQPDGTLQSMTRSEDFLRILALYPFRRDGEIGFIGYSRHSSNQLEPEPLNLNTTLVAEFDRDGRRTGTPIDTTNALPLLRGNQFTFQHWYRWPMPVVSISGQGKVAWTFGEEYEVKLYDPATGIHRGVRIPSDKIPITTEMKNWIYENYREGTQREEARRALRFPEHLQTVGAMIWDTVDRLWVRRHFVYGRMEPTYVFQVFSAEGEWLFQQTLPDDPRLITESGCFIRSELEDDTMVIRRYEFVER